MPTPLSRLVRGVTHTPSPKSGSQGSCQIMKDQVMLGYSPRFAMSISFLEANKEMKTELVERCPGLGTWSPQSSPMPNLSLQSR